MQGLHVGIRVLAAEVAHGRGDDKAGGVADDDPGRLGGGLGGGRGLGGRAQQRPGAGKECLADEALAAGWEAIPALRTGGGPGGWKASIARLRGVFSDLTVIIEDVAVSGDLVAVRSMNRGVHTGELLGVPGTGRRIEFRASDFHRLAGGRITATWHLEDYFGIATQLGLTFPR